MREIDSRVRCLTNRLDDVTIVERIPQDTNKVYFGAWITLESDDGENTCYRIVGADELDTSRGYISIDSPLANALIGKHLG